MINNPPLNKGMNIKEFDKELVGHEFLDSSGVINEIVWVRDDLKLITVEYNFHASPLRNQTQFNVKEFNATFVRWEA